MCSYSSWKHLAYSFGFEPVESVEAQWKARNAFQYTQKELQVVKGPKLGFDFYE